jgi:hypothetical protein
MDCRFAVWFFTEAWEWLHTASLKCKCGMRVERFQVGPISRSGGPFFSVSTKSNSARPAPSELLPLAADKFSQCECHLSKTTKRAQSPHVSRSPAEARTASDGRRSAAPGPGREGRFSRRQASANSVRGSPAGRVSLQPEKPQPIVAR